MEIGNLVIVKGFKVISIELKESSVWVQAKSCQTKSTCPACKQVSQVVHSRYERKVKDLPITGQKVELVLEIQRFYCCNQACDRKTFAEDFSDVAHPRVRQTVRFRTRGMMIGMMLGGESGA